MQFLHKLPPSQLEVEFFDIKLSFYSKSFFLTNYRCFAVKFFDRNCAIGSGMCKICTYHIHPQSHIFASLACKIGIFLIVQAELAQMKELGWQNRSQFATGRFELSSIP